MAEENILFFIQADGAQAIEEIQAIATALQELLALMDQVSAASEAMAATQQAVADAVTGAQQAITDQQTAIEEATAAADENTAAAVENAAALGDQTDAAMAVEEAQTNVATAADEAMTAWEDQLNAVGNINAAYEGFQQALDNFNQVLTQTVAGSDEYNTAADQVIATHQALQDAIDNAAQSQQTANDVTTQAIVGTDAQSVAVQDATEAIDNAAMATSDLGANLTLTGQGFFDFSDATLAAGAVLDSITGTAQNLATNGLNDSLVPALNGAGNALLATAAPANSLMSAAGDGIGIAEAFGSAWEVIGPVLDTVGGAFGAVGTAIFGTNDNLDQLNTTGQGSEFMLLMLAMGLIQVSGSFLQMGMSAQDAMSRVAGLADQSLAGTQHLAQFGAVTQQVANLAMTFGVSMTNAANGLYYIMSAGFNVTDSLSIMKVTLEASAASGVQMNTIANALTSTLNAFGLKASDATMIMNQMTAGVVAGKQTFQEFANVIGELSAVAANNGVSFKEMVAAEATMTEVNPRVLRDAQDLMHLMETLHNKVDTIAKDAASLGINFNETAFKTMDFTQQLQYLAKITGGPTTQAFRTLLTDQTSARAAQMILINGMQNYDNNLKKVTNSQQALNIAYQEYTTTITSGANRVGAALSVLAMGAVVQIAPIVVPLLNHIADALQFLATHAQIAAPIIGALAGVVGGILLAALISLVGFIGSMLAPFAGLIVLAGVLGATFAALAPKVAAFMQSLGKNAAVQQVIGTFKAAATIIGRDLTQALQQASQWFSKAGQVIGSIAGPSLKTLGQDLLTTAHTIAINLVPGFERFLTAVQPIGAYLMAHVVPALGQFVKWAIEAADWIVNHLVPGGKSAGPIFQAMGKIFSEVGTVLHAVGSYLATTFAPVMKQFPLLWQDLVTAVQPALPLLKMIGTMLLAVLGTAIVFVISVIGGLIHAFANVLVGVMEVIGGIVRLASGLLSIIPNAIQFVVDLIHGNWSGAWKDAGNIVQSIFNIIFGVLEIAKGIFDATFGAIQGFTQGFATTIVGIIKNLANIIVGHSIIPDMMSAILGVFTGGLPAVVGLFLQFGTQVITAVQKVFSGAVNVLSQLPGKFMSIAQSAMSGLASTITNLAGTVIGAAAKMAGNVASAIAGFLHFSKPDIGPLADVDQWMPHFGDVLAAGLNRQINKVKAAAQNVATAVTIGAPSVGNISNNAQITAQSDPATLSVLQQILAEIKNGNAQRGNAISHPLPSINLGALVQTAGGNTQGANVGYLYQQLNQVAGFAAEQAGRGASSGIAF